MTITTIFRPMTVTQFQEMVEQGLFAEGLRLELIDGRIHEMSPVGRIHSSVVTRLMDRMPRHFGQDYTYAAQNPVQLLSNFQPLPDYAILHI